MPSYLDIILNCILFPEFLFGGEEKKTIDLYENALTPERIKKNIMSYAAF